MLHPSWSWTLLGPQPYFSVWLSCQSSVLICFALLLFICFTMVLQHAGLPLRVPALGPGLQSHLRLRARLGAKNGVGHPGVPQTGVRPGWGIWPPARVWFWPWSRVWPWSRIWQADDVKPWRWCAGTVQILSPRNCKPSTFQGQGLCPLQGYGGYWHHQGSL